MKIHVSRLTSHVSRLTSHVSRLVFCLVVSFSLFFSGCHDDYLAQTAPLENDISTKPISIDEAKTWFQQQQIGSANANPTDDSLLILPSANPNWDSAFNSLNPQNRDYVIAPLDLSGNGGSIQTKLLITRNSAGTPIGICLSYFADDAYHLRTNGNYSPQDFSGKAIYSDLNGRFLYGFKIDNGQLSYSIYAKKQDANISQIIQGNGTLSLRGCTTRPVLVEVCPSVLIALTSHHCWYYIVYERTCERNLPSFHGDNDVWVSGSSGGSWGNGQPTILFSAAQLVQVQKLFRDNGLFELYETLQSNQAELRLVYNFLKTSSLTDIAIFKKYNDEGFTYPEFNDIFSNQSLFTKSETFLNVYSSRSDFRQCIQEIMIPTVNVSGLPISRAEKIKRYEAFIDITNDFKTELTQFAQQTDATITSGGDMNLLMRIFGKVLGKKIGKVIPFVGTALGAEAAWTAYNLGNYGVAAFELAGIAMDFIPAGVVLETGWTVVGVAYDAFKAYKPISKISGYCTGAFTDIFTGLFKTIDELNLLDKLGDITTGNSITNIRVNLSNAGKTVDDFLDNLALALGKTWDLYPGGAKRIDLGLNSDIFFYTRTSTGNPGIRFRFDGVDVFKIDFN
jgi:hypothetical protein